MLDLDKFKEVNDTFGHTIGDEALIKFAKALKKIIRDSDNVFRYGGDEFLSFSTIQIKTAQYRLLREY